MPSSVFKKRGLSRFRSRLKNLISNVGEDLDLLVKGQDASTASAPEEAAPESDLDVDPSLESEQYAIEEQLDEATELAEQQINADFELIAQWRSEVEHLQEERRRRKADHPLMIDDSYNYIHNLITGHEERVAEMVAREATDEKGADEDADLASAATESIEPDEPEVEAFSPADLEGFQKPTLDLLRKTPPDECALMRAEELENQKTKLQDTLDSFAVDAFVYDAIVGPRVTQFRVKPGFGVRVESIASLDKNISLGLAVNAVRIQAPIPGEPFVGVEVPNGNSIPLTLRAALESRTWKETEGELPLALGMDITGHITLCDLAKAPHLLIAGATGSGKSVCINNLILSLVYRFNPDELELVLVDPKKVEFALYKELPHLIHPVVSEPKQACQALKWLVREMEGRYEELSTKQVRNIAGYNAKAEAEGFKKLPYIVLIIDELADLMMTAQEDVETPIARLAQMSRAVGIHTVLATQRPSVNVLTGVIKANYPTRIAFQVSSLVDSRTILDCKGAESLQGRGDMLYNPPGLSRLIRLQAPYVDDDEILTVGNVLKEQLQPRFRVKFRPEDAPGGKAGAGEDATGEGGDDLLKQAMEIVATTKRASTSYLQRRLRIGYNRAANLVEELEQRRYIGPQVGSNPREVYIEPGDIS